MNLVLGIVVIWVVLFYLGFLLIDVKHDLRAMRRHMDQIANRRIR
jgi:hypothetical protein